MKRLLPWVFFVVTAATWAEGTSAGGAVSVFVPETLYLEGRGSLAFEQGLSTSLGLGDVLSVPLGFAYHAAQGFRLEDPSVHPTDEPVLYGDSLIPYVHLKAHLPLGSVFYLEAFGGGALDWAFSLDATDAFARSLAGSNEVVAVQRVTIDRGLGFGWTAGGALGVKIGKISVDLGGTYRSLGLPVTVHADVVRVKNGVASAPETLTLSNAWAVLRGVSVQLGGHYEF